MDKELKELSELFRDSKLALLFGSFLKKGKGANDIDLLYIGKELKLPKEKFGKFLDIINYSEKEIETRVTNNDYGFASILEDSNYLCGDKEYLDYLKKNIYRKINKQSINFNRAQAIEYIDFGRMSMNMSRHFSRRDHEHKIDQNFLKSSVFGNNFVFPLKSYSKEYFLHGIGNYSFAFGYKLAAKEMKNKRLLTFNQLKDSTLHRLCKLQDTLKKSENIDEAESFEVLNLIGEIEHEIRIDKQ